MHLNKNQKSFGKIISLNYTAFLWYRTLKAFLHRSSCKINTKFKITCLKSKLPKHNFYYLNKLYTIYNLTKTPIHL